MNIKYINSYLLLTIVLFAGCNAKDRENYEAKVTKVWGRQILLDNGRKVGLIGIYIPQADDVNYIPELQANIISLLEGKQVKVQLVLPKHLNGYPKLDLAKVYLNNMQLNEFLLKNGKAFFYEDYWDKKEKEYFRKLENEAKEKKIGLWKHKEKLKPLLIRNINWRRAYSPDCKYVIDIPKEQRIEYFTPLPDSPRKGILIDNSCAEPDSSLFLEN